MRSSTGLIPLLNRSTLRTRPLAYRMKTHRPTQNTILRENKQKSIPTTLQQNTLNPLFTTKTNTTLKTPLNKQKPAFPSNQALKTPA